MKISVITLAVCLSSISAYGQVGINTQTPAATLDVAARTTGTSATTPEGLIAPRLTIADLNAKASAYGTAQAGSLIYITDAANGSPSGQTASINAIGYYFFDGSVWLKVTTGSTGSTNDIYSSDGALAADRTVALSDKTLAFTANPTTGTSHFTVDGATLSVDALNNRVGIGTNVPTEKLHIENGNMFMHHDSPTIYFQSTIPDDYSNPNNNNGSIVFYNGANSTTEGMYMRHVNNPTGYVGGNQLQFGSINNGAFTSVLNIGNITKQVLIGTTSPSSNNGNYSKLVINSDTANGAIQIIDGTQGNNKVLTSDAIGRGTWKSITGLAAPSTTYTWDNPGASGTLGYYQNYVYGPYTVGKTGWYEIQSKWRYIQSPPSVSGNDQGVGSLWMQINTSGTNSMYALTDPSLADQPIDETMVANQLFSMAMLSGRMLYLTSGKNYFIHLTGAYLDVVGSQRFILNYIQ
jgi:hypothetical protein